MNEQTAIQIPHKNWYFVNSIQCTINLHNTNYKNALDKTGASLLCKVMWLFSEYYTFHCSQKPQPFSSLIYKTTIKSIKKKSMLSMSSK